MSHSDLGDIVRLTFGDSLAYGHLKQACYTLRVGGLCLLPSDTCYSLAALPWRRDALEHLAKILPEKATDPILLAFGSLAMVAKYAELTAKDERLIDQYCPGPLTLVCQLKDIEQKDAMAELLHTQGTVSIRIPDSTVERQISIELDRPITTCPVRYESGEPVRSFDDAVSVVRDRMTDLDEDFIVFAVRMNFISYSDLSTVTTVQPEAVPEGERLVEPYSAYIFRPGVIEPEQLEGTLRKLSWSDYEEWT